MEHTNIKPELKELYQWQRLLSKNGKIRREHLIVASRVLAVYQCYGRLADARQAAELMTAWARELSQASTPESLRDPAVSLSKIGDLLIGRNQEAARYYLEGLELGERLTQMLPDLPDYAMVKPFFQQRLDTLMK